MFQRFKNLGGKKRTQIEWYAELFTSFKIAAFRP